MKKLSAVAVTALLVGGGTFATDAAINPYEDRGETLEIVKESVVEAAGDLKVELVKERPEVRLSKWDGEAEFSVRYERVQADGSRAFLTDRVEWKGDGEEVHAYPLEATAQMEDGGFEIEIVLDGPPVSNRFDFAIGGAEELDFFYQDALTAEDIADGYSRPENVVGSYAVYHKTLKDHQIGNTNYATGKAFHIFRPKAIDADGAEVWCELSYEEGRLSVACPDRWIETAAYPVRVDPTFGYTTQGASTSASSASTIVGTLATLSESGTVSKLTVYLFNTISWAVGENAKGGVFDASGTYLSKETVEIAGPQASAGWYDFAFSVPFDLTATNYLLAIWSSASITWGADSGSSGQLNDTAGQTYPTWPASVTTGSTFIKSIYATYSTSGGVVPNSGVIFFE